MRGNITEQCAVAVALALALPAAGFAPAPFGNRHTGAWMPVGRWTVKFTNGVVETCKVRRDGMAWVTEPRRTADGKAAFALHDSQPPASLTTAKERETAA